MDAGHAVTPVDGTTSGDVQRPFDFSVSDFATIVTTTAYVDKSLMIRDVYNASSRILITAPPRFGKSTNLDMVKRFFEIEVDPRGIAKPVQTTNNYKLFKDYNLEICKDIGFVNKHFGKYPVVHIDFKPLGRVHEAAKIFNAFKIIIENSFNQHYYILQHSLKEQVFSGITGIDENDFINYVSGGISEDVDEDNLVISFKHLSTILKRIFGRKVYVLIDSYDAFLDSPLFENSTDREKMMSFVKSSIGQLLNNVSCVDRVLITGVIPVIFEGFICSENNIEFYHFLDSHSFTQYYGLTSAEVDTVLSKFIECDEERCDIRYTINDYYNAYETRNQDIRVYSVWSVLQYVRRRTVQSYWCERRYINKFRKYLKIESIRQKLEKLLLGNELQLDISQPLSMTDVLKVNSMITSCDDDEDDDNVTSVDDDEDDDNVTSDDNDEDYDNVTSDDNDEDYENVTSDDNNEDVENEYLTVEVEIFFILLYHFGYLSVISELGMEVVCVNIPSEEIKYELVKAVFDENRKFYSSPDVYDILSVLDAFQPHSTHLKQDFKILVNSVCNWHESRRFPFLEIMEYLYVNLVGSAKYSRVMGRKLGPDGPMVILLKNKHKVAICVTDEGLESIDSAFQKVTRNDYEKHLRGVFNDARGTVIIVVCKSDMAVGKSDKQYRIRWHLSLKSGKN